MSKTQAGPVSAGRIKSFVERAEKLIEERASIQSDIKDVFSEAKGVGYDVKTLRSLIRVRAMDMADRAEQETLLDVYMHAVGMETAAHVIQPTEEELLEQAGRIIGEVDRCLVLASGGKPPKIADIQELIGCSAGKAHKLRGLLLQRFSRSDEIIVKNENEIPAHDADGVITEINPGAGAAEQQSHGPTVAAAPTEAEQSSGSPAAVHNGGGSNDQHPDLVQPGRRQDSVTSDDAPAGALKAGPSDGGSDDGRLTVKLEVARVAPPAPGPQDIDLAIPDFLRRAKVPA